MAPADDFEVEGRVDMRARPAAFLGDLGERREYVETRKAPREPLQIVRTRENERREFVEDRNFARQSAIGGGRDFALQLDEFARREAHRVGHRLAMRESRVEGRAQQPLSLRARRFEKIAKEVVVLDADFRLRLRGVFRFELDDHLAAVVAQRAGFVEFRIAPFANEIAVAPIDRLAVRKTSRNLRRQCRIGGCERFGLARNFLRWFEPREKLRDILRRRKRGADAREIAWAAALQGEPRHCAGEVGRARQLRAQGCAQLRAFEKKTRGVEPRADLRGVGERRRETLRDEPRAARRDRDVDNREERSFARARERSGQLQIDARRSVDIERCALAFAARACERGLSAFLRALHIKDRGRRRDQFNIAKRPEAFERRNAEIVREAARRGGGVARVTAERRDRRAIGGEKRAERRIVAKRFRRDDLARLHARKRGSKFALAAFAHDKDARRYIEVRETVAPAAVGAAQSRHRREGVGAGWIEQRVFRDRAGRHEPRHVAPHDRLRAAFLRLRRIFELLADGDAMAERDELLQIVVGALHRHAAHGNILAQVLAALREHDAERARRDLRVVEKQFVEIAHAVEEQAVGIGRLDLDILRDHRRRAGLRFVVGCLRARRRGVLHGGQCNGPGARTPRAGRTRCGRERRPGLEFRDIRFCCWFIWSKT